MLLMVMALAFLGPFFGIFIGRVYKIVYYVRNKDAPPSSYEWDVFILATSGWYVLMISFLFDWVTHVVWSSS